MFGIWRLSPGGGEDDDGDDDDDDDDYPLTLRPRTLSWTNKNNDINSI